MPLATLPDLFDDKTHNDLDRAVEKDVTDDLADPSELSPGFIHITLLSSIIANSKDSLDTKLDDVPRLRDLLKNNSELGDMLTDAWEHRSFRVIRNIAILRAREHARYDDFTALHMRLAWSFRAKYFGAAVEGFREYLTENQKRFRTVRHPSYHAKVCSVVQSSGTGKSRMLTELGTKDAIVVFMNLREKGDKFSFPLRDRIPSRILIDHDFTPHVISYWVVCYAFFTALFTTLEEYLSLDQNSMTRVKIWARQMCDLHIPPRSDTRDNFFERFSAKYLEVHSDFLRIFRQVPGPHRAGYNNRPDIPEFTTRLLNSFESMAACLTKIFPNNPDEPKLVIAFDEAHTLFPDEPNREEYSLHHILCQVVSEYSNHQDHAVWVVFASTTPKITNLSPPDKKYPAQRRRIFLPYTQLGWDQFAPDLGKVDAEDVSKLDNILGYGRPLWFSLKIANSSPHSVLDLASAKLCGTLGRFHADQTSHVLSVLGQRFALDVTFGHPEAVKYLEKGVASHLRFYLSRTLDNIWVFTNYPSEPLLSCMAAFTLHEWTRNLGPAMKTLLSAVKDGLIGVDRRGELVSRLLWLLAKDLFVRKRVKVHLAYEWDESLPDCEMIPVAEWLEFVFGPRIWNEDGQKSLARGVFDNAYMNFTHWICMQAMITSGSGDEDELRLDEWTRRHWQRTSALQCCEQEPRISKVIPIYFSALGSEGGSAESRMSHILILNHARASVDSKNALKEITRLGGDGGTSSDTKPLPYIAIAANFGQQQSFSVTSTDRDDEERCLRVYAGGIDATTYPFLADHPELAETLVELVRLCNGGERETPFMKYLGAQFEFGSTPGTTHMEWEHGRTVPNFSEGGSEDHR